MKVQYKRVFYGILIIIWMVVIFAFSSQNGGTSQGTSDVITIRIMDLSDKLKSQERNISVLVRKTAHFLIYFLGGILIYGFNNTFNVSQKKVILFSILAGVIYSSSDEMHQLFVPGRSGQITDVVLDTIGVSLAVVIRSLINNKKESCERK